MTAIPDLYRCRVCGMAYEDDPPWGEDGRSASFNICLCCGVEFGYQDCLPASVRAYRRKWLDAGGRWRGPELCPPGWSLAEQLLCIPAAYREEANPPLGAAGPAGPSASRDT